MRSTTHARKTLGLLLALGLMAATTGCSGDGTPTASAAPAQTAAAEVPTQSDLTAWLDLSEEQAEALAPLLATWQESRDEARPRSRGQNRGQGHAGRGNPGLEPPVGAFLRGAAAILTPDQMVLLGNHLVERREQRREEMRAGLEDQRGHGPGEGPGFGRHGERQGRPGNGERGRFLDELDLTEEQRTQLGEARKTMRQAMQGLRQRFRDDEIDAAGLRDGEKALEQNRQAVLGSILDEEQYAAWQEHRRERQQEMAERRLERLGERGERRLDFLTDVLRLDDPQRSAVAAVQADAQAAMKTLLESFGNGGIDRADLGFETHGILESAREGILATLTGEQAAVFEALEPLAPAGRKHHRHGR